LRVPLPSGIPLPRPGRPARAADWARLTAALVVVGGLAVLVWAAVSQLRGGPALLDRPAAQAAAAPGRPPASEAGLGSPAGTWRRLGRPERLALARRYLDGPGRPSAVQVSAVDLVQGATALGRTALGGDRSYSTEAMLGLAARLADPSALV